jgi:hypothetical protein
MTDTKSLSERLLEEDFDREHDEKLRKIRAKEIPCDFCNVKLTIPVCPRCGNPNADRKKGAP